MPVSASSVDLSIFVRSGFVTCHMGADSFSRCAFFPVRKWDFGRGKRNLQLMASGPSTGAPEYCATAAAWTSPRQYFVFGLSGRTNIRPVDLFTPPI